MPRPKKIVVVGAGIAGLETARRLAEDFHSNGLDYEITVVDQAPGPLQAASGNGIFRVHGANGYHYLACPETQTACRIAEALFDAGAHPLKLHSQWRDTWYFEAEDSRLPGQLGVLATQNGDNVVRGELLKGLGVEKVVAAVKTRERYLKYPELIEGFMRDLREKGVKFSFDTTVVSRVTDHDLFGQTKLLQCKDKAGRLSTMEAHMVVFCTNNPSLSELIPEPSDLELVRSPLPGTPPEERTSWGHEGSAAASVDQQAKDASSKYITRWKQVTTVTLAKEHAEQLPAPKGGALVTHGPFVGYAYTGIDTDGNYCYSLTSERSGTMDVKPDADLDAIATSVWKEACEYVPVFRHATIVGKILNIVPSTPDIHTKRHQTIVKGNDGVWVFWSPKMTMVPRGATVTSNAMTDYALRQSPAHTMTSPAPASVGVQSMFSQRRGATGAASPVPTPPSAGSAVQVPPSPPRSNHDTSSSDDDDHELVAAPGGQSLYSGPC